MDGRNRGGREGRHGRGDIEEAGKEDVEGVWKGYMEGGDKEEAGKGDIEGEIWRGIEK